LIHFMLDTNVCVDLLRGRNRGIIGHIERHADELSISTIVVAELQHGVFKSSDPTRHLNILANFFAPFEILPFDELAAGTYGRIRSSLEQAGTPIGPLDTLIAAHALSLDCTLVTNNEREFRRVDGLLVENWTI
jgi:tRNA(fMet)-specific endonuclease VapC